MPDHSLRPSISDEIAEYHRIAASYLSRPPDPRFSVLAIGWYQKALQNNPRCIETHLKLAQAHHKLGQHEQALRCCTQALAIEPESLAVRYVACMLQLPILYRTQEAITLCRHQYREQLLALQHALKNAPTYAVAELADIVGMVSPFYLIYQGHNDVELQTIYGQIVCHILAARYPQYAFERQLPLPAVTEPLRIGVVFGHFHKHSVWKVVVKGWLAHLDHDRFQLTGYSLGTRQDEETELARSLLHAYIEGPHSIESWGEIISADQPHILLYPEVSMSRVAIQLSALRLAPIQCTTWATYVTSGLPTIDYYLSGELLEPTDAAQHHTEQLVLLPTLSIHYSPLRVATADLDRAAFGLRPSAVVYLCIQSLFKYLPQYDAIYPRIAKAVGDCQFVFLKHKSAESLTRIFVNRLRAAFAAQGLDMERYVVMQPALSDAAYHRLNELADVFLDSIGVAGTTTTLEAIEYDLPIVTLPSPFLRGRVSNAILQRMSVTLTIAESVEHYVAVATRLGQDTVWRQKVTAQMARNKQHVYEDMDCVEALEEAFLTFAERMRTAQ